MQKYYERLMWLLLEKKQLTIGLVDNDKTTWRNNALMRWSSWAKTKGHTVLYPYDGAQPVDAVIVSTVFTFSRPELLNLFRVLKVRGTEECQPADMFVKPKEGEPNVMRPAQWIVDALAERNVFVGGSGWDWYSFLPDDVAACPLDYDLDNAVKGPAIAAQGPSSEGCFRGPEDAGGTGECDFCGVGYLSGSVPTPVKTFEQMLEGGRFKRLLLMDDQFLGTPPTHREKEMQWAAEHDIEVCFSQGIDGRLISPRIAKLFPPVQFKDTIFKNRVLTVAMDNANTADKVMRGITNLIKAGVQPDEIQSFVLVRFNSTPEQDLYRVNLLRQTGIELMGKPEIRPYIMPYIAIHGEEVPEFYLEEKNKDLLAQFGEHLDIPHRYSRYSEWTEKLQRWCNLTSVWMSVNSFDELKDLQRLKARWAKEDRQGYFFPVSSKKQRRGREGQWKVPEHKQTLLKLGKGR